MTVTNKLTLLRVILAKNKPTASTVYSLLKRGWKPHHLLPIMRSYDFFICSYSHYEFSFEAPTSSSRRNRPPFLRNTVWHKPKHMRPEMFDIM